MSDPSVRASDPTVSAWVAAHAGAGKTYTLANRVTRLLLAGAKPQRILCLTFTKAAAAEMQGRLFAQLGRWSMLPDAALRENIIAIGAKADDLPKARRLFAQALETPGGLKVLTIHAFCQIVLSRFPIEASIAPGFDVADEQTARKLVAEARQNVLERAGGGDARLAQATALLVAETSEESLSRVLGAALGSDRRKLDRFFASLGADGFEEAAWRAQGVARGADVRRDFCAALKNDIAILTEAIQWLSGGGKADVETADALMRFVEFQFSADGFAVLGEIFLTLKGEQRKKLATKALGEARPDLLTWLGELQQRFCAAEESHRAARAAALAEAALTLIDAVRRDYAEAKARRGLLDYDDLIVTTLALLETSEAAAWVLYKLDGGLDHVLVDEAQDTSPEQWAILRRLTEEFFSVGGRTIFAVGDEKQSIFSFQGADPREFDVNRSHFTAQAAGAGQQLREQPLIQSRRSAPEILRFVDTVFESEAARAGLTSQNEPIAHEAHRAAAKGGIEFWTALPVPQEPEIDHWRPVDAAQPDSSVARLAAKVADTIRAWVRGGVALPDHDQPITAGDIMILLPRREPFGSEVIRQLKLRGIPVAGADRITLTEQIAVMDLIALGRFALQREDDLNLAALLRSPLCGISEEDLFALCHGRKDTVWQALASRAGVPFEAAHAFLSEMLSRADYAPPFEFYSFALTARGKKRDLLARLGPESSDAIEELLSLALAYERGQTPSLEGFLDWVERGGNEVKRDMEQGRDEVRVMTVHGAKGLEADIVILPDTTSLPDPPSRKGHLLFDGGDVLFPLAEAQAPERVRAAKEAEIAETLMEHRRLLYVALTRAKDRLYVCGFENAKGIREGSWYRLAEEAARKLGRTITLHDEEFQAFGHVENEPRSEADTARKEADRAPSWLWRTAPREMVLPRLIRPSDALDLPDPPTLSPLGSGADRFKRGNVVHALLARLPELPAQARRGAALAYALANGFDEALVDETLAVLTHPDFAPAFTPQSRAEVAFLAELPEFGPGAQVNGRIDRLAVTPDGVLILDFKTNRPPPAREADVAPVYLGQMALYRAGAARIFPGRRIVCGLLWTDGPVLMRLSDGILDAQLAGIRQRLDPDGGHS